MKTGIGKKWPGPSGYNVQTDVRVVVGRLVSKGRTRKRIQVVNRIERCEIYEAEVRRERVWWLVLMLVVIWKRFCRGIEAI